MRIRFGLIPVATIVLPFSSAHPTSEEHTRVDLGYSTYEGIQLSNGVRQFLGMRYAAPPLGNDRFRRPREPVKARGIIPAKKHGAVCYGVQGLAFRSAPVPLAEDCLFIDVYTPSNSDGTRPSPETREGLPVLVWLQGGAFVQLFNPNYNGTGIVEASRGKAIVVSFNYRVGPYGFLANEDLRKEGNLNVGLHDQRFAMSWVQKHIKAFGGDPNRVTLFGTSVGAGSILLHTVAYEGEPPSPDNARWNAGIAPAVYIPSVFNISDLEFESRALLAATNCTSIACLRSLDSETIQRANIANPYPGQSQVALFPYAPVIDDDLFTDRPQNLLKAGKFARHRPLIIGSSHSEGTLFAPQADLTADIDSFLKRQFPALTEADLNTASYLYETVNSTIPGVTAPQSAQFYKAAEIYGDVSFNCPTLQFTTQLSKAGAEVYYFRNNIIDPVEYAAGYLVPHTWEVQAAWGPEYAVNYVALPNATSYDIGGANRKAVEQVQDIWIGFSSNSSGWQSGNGQMNSPAWVPFNSTQQRLRLQTNATVLERVSRVELERCAFWSSISARTFI
ncbi:Alpha/Beta hydrolase protein [Dendryphion nanum]|uniref:Alpha/Beta hydrolase protein n=1 Tax=Dendryphion nanum TaxID=256645 RepID=A0A9P9IRK2_9PLEO|nr:Alpha/Beta hydrolase protein [Dendryphion nanum]